MYITEVARSTGVTVKALRYYESIGLISPKRAANGYRHYDDDDVRAVAELRELSALGIPPGKAAPFLECLGLGHEHGDECVSSLAVYRDTIAELDHMIAELTARRDALQVRLNDRASFATPVRSFPSTSPYKENTMTDFTSLPAGLPVPEDDGAADHLPGLRVPDIQLTASDGSVVDLGSLGPGRTVVYLYPLSGRPGVDLPEGWDSIPGARGCSTEACDFRDHFADLRGAGAERVYGLSSQDPGYQAKLVDRLRLPFTMLSDQDFALGDAMGLPVFAAPGHERLYARLTLVIRDGAIEHVFYPIFPPNTHGQQVLEWLVANPEG